MELINCVICNKLRKPTFVDSENICCYCKATQKRKETCLKKYGVENIRQNSEAKEKAKKTCLENYGVEHSFQSEKVKEKIKQTNLEKYGVENPLQSKTVLEKRNETFLEKYNGKNSFQSNQIREKIKQKLIQKYGVDNPLKSTKIQKKKEQTCFEKYGKSNPLSCKDIQEKVKQTTLQKYGVEFYAQTQEAQKHRKSRYFFDNIYFDSKPELAFYIYQKDQNKNISRYSGQGFEYYNNEQKHLYFPDFEITEDGKKVFYEIKGNQFIGENGVWQNPFDESKNNLYEAKHQCVLENNVIIIDSTQYQKYLKYIFETYGNEIYEKSKIRRT